MRIHAIVLASAALAAVACSSPADPFGPTPDFGAIRTQLAHPTGTFSGRESVVLSAYADQNKSAGVASSLVPGVAGSSTPKASAIHALASGAPTPFCAVTALGQGSCTCGGGGTITWDFTGVASSGGGGSFEGLGKIAASACKTSDGATSLDGREFIDVRGTGGTAGQSATAAILYDAHFIYGANGQVGRLDMDFQLVESGGTSAFQEMLTVPDGTVVASGTWDATTRTGKLVVTDKIDSFTCEGTDGKSVTCTDSHGVARTVTI